MPPFSLVRRFGKQRKVTIDSPVSSGLVEQHVSPTMAESSHSQIRQPSEAGNVFSSTRAANSHGLTSGLVALSQHMEGVSIRNINAPVMSNNHVNINNNSINNYYGPDANFEDSDAMLRVGDIYLEEEFERYMFVDHVGWTRYRGHITTCSNMNMSIWTYRGEKAAETICIIASLYGICCSPHLTALVFHGAPSLIYRPEYYKMLPSSQWIPHYLKLHQQHQHAGGPQLARRPTAYSALDTRIWMAFETNTFIKEDLLDYYKFLYDMIFPSSYARITSPFEQTAPFQLSHPEINLPIYSLPGWNKFVFEVNGMNTTVKETGIVLTLLPNMTIREVLMSPPDVAFQFHRFQDCQSLKQSGDLSKMMRRYLQHGPAKQTASSKIFLLTSWIYKPLRISELWTTVSWIECAAKPINAGRKDTESPTLNNVLEAKHLYLFCPQNSAGNIYWSQDEEGQHVIEDSLIQAAFGITCYQILCTIHEVCGFDPYSTEVAEYLGLPLAVINNGYSGLEEYVEGSEYTSESESGDSDYVSASEDA
ncbi:hypothetical protein C8J56DRAFT_1082029 [Mycena floridula]|nr:hypothetical protein C8J56DRAFT_1082029 [Mycena floridula]